MYRYIHIQIFIDRDCMYIYYKYICRNTHTHAHIYIQHLLLHLSKINSTNPVTCKLKYKNINIY